jgi:hypothetical protein
MRKIIGLLGERERRRLQLVNKACWRMVVPDVSRTVSDGNCKFEELEDILPPGVRR